VQFATMNDAIPFFDLTHDDEQSSLPKGFSMNLNLSLQDFDLPEEYFCDDQNAQFQFDFTNEYSQDAQDLENMQFQIDSVEDDLRDNDLRDNDLQDNDLQDNDLQDNDLQDNDLQDNDLQDNDLQDCGHSCGLIDRPNNKELKPSCSFTKKNGEICGSLISQRSCPHMENDVFVGLCFKHYDVSCKKRKWYYNLSDCANKKCDELGIKESRKLITNNNIEKKIGLPKNGNHCFKSTLKKSKFVVDSDEESDEDSDEDSDEESDEESDEDSDEESDEDSDEESDEESDKQYGKLNSQVMVKRKSFYRTSKRKADDDDYDNSIRKKCKITYEESSSDDFLSNSLSEESCDESYNEFHSESYNEESDDF